MNGAALVLALATLGVDFGWQLDSKGQLEYIIQISPSQYESLRNDPTGVSSQLPEEVMRSIKNFRTLKFRIVVGDNQLPRDPIPSDGLAPEARSSEIGSLSLPPPPSSDNPRFNPDLRRPGDFRPPARLTAGFETAGSDSAVTPLEGFGAPQNNVLPGPGADNNSRDLGDPVREVDTMLALPPIPRAYDTRSEFGSLAATMPRAVIRQQNLDSGLRPNVNAPDASDTFNSSNRRFENSPVVYDEPYPSNPPRRDLGRTIDPFGDRFGASDKPWSTLALTVCALCLSIGGNIYLAWIAWGYYLRYRESFEQWRSS